MLGASLWQRVIDAPQRDTHGRVTCPIQVDHLDRDRPRPPSWLRSRDPHDLSIAPGAVGRQIDLGLADFLSNLLIPLPLATVGWGLWQIILLICNINRTSKLHWINNGQTILQTYIDNMRDLLLNHNLAKSAPGDEVRQVARVQTLTTLRSLDATRNRIVLQFLQDARLIGTQDAVINLNNADLSNDDLSGADLSGIDLTGADLTGAHLSDADLSGATLFSANLRRCRPKRCQPERCFLTATLTGADLNGAHLSNATLTSAFLGDAI